MPTCALRADAGRLGNHGKVVWIQATYNPILDLNGKPYKVVKFAIDISEQVNMETGIQAKAANDSRKVEALLACVARAARTLERVCLTALSGWGTDEHRARSRFAGIDHHLTKPVQLAEVVKLLA